MRGWIPRFFRIAAIYGLLVLPPAYLQPWPAEHPEAFLGFIGIATTFQLVFWVIASDPSRYRALMPIAVLEKLSFGAPGLLLFALGRVDTVIAVFATIDLLLGLGFLLAWKATPRD